MFTIPGDRGVHPVGDHDLSQGKIIHAGAAGGAAPAQPTDNTEFFSGGETL
ncbi:hypothetical protein [Streptomyces poonensis]|uniref:Uncharacterized protein n=1 Tax=Streptomyces poonensis TaxID=68255 RepID=A0A918PCV5_9ACTN|nr:hypothetical protein [Streptomyces poonensis]GGY99307.1 hypothetical protein GCM10010365_17490 [Streptomyces poonensis]